MRRLQELLLLWTSQKMASLVARTVDRGVTEWESVDADPSNDAE